MPLSKEELAQALEDASKGASLEQFVGETLVFEDFETDQGQFGEFLRVNCINSEGESVRVSTGSTVVVSQLKKMKELEAFPFEALVTSYRGQYGKDGYKLEVA